MELQGKIIDFLGDSITEGAGVENLDHRYDNRIAKQCGLAATYNYGIGGTRIAHQQKVSCEPRFDLSFCGRAYDLNPAADIIVVFGGTNDYGHGDAPFGTMEDKTPATFCGGVDFLMNYLLTNYPGKTVVFMTPARREGDEAISTDGEKGADAKPLKAYVSVIKEKAAAYGIPVLDLYETLGINPNLPEDKAAYTADGLHLNDAGHGILANVLIDFLTAL